MSRSLTRRHFLLSSAALGAAGFGVKPTLGQQQQRPPANERLRVGCVGICGQARSDITAIAAAGAEIVALCDVDEHRRDYGARVKEYPRARLYSDFRRMIDAGGLDAVVVATPDHTHAHPTLRALQANLHVFCEKPLTHTVEEARRVAQLALKQRRVTQMGTQIHAGSNYRRVVELVQAGAIGDIREVHVWVGTNYTDKGRPEATPPVPKGLNWDLWLGPAPERPYHPTYVPFNWRRWWDFGGGALNDMACHYMDLPFWALNLRHPTHVEATGPDKPHAECAPAWLTVRYDFPARGRLPACRLTWYDSGRKPRLVTDGTALNWGNGVLFVGSRGMLQADYNRHQLLPENQFRDFERPRQSIPDSVGHYREWVDACRNGGTTTCNFDYSGALTEAVLLGTVSYRLGKGFDWDGRDMKCSEPAAERFIRKQYRRGWELPR